MVLGLLANVGTAVGSEVASSLLDKTVSGVGKKSFGKILSDTLTDPWSYIPFGGLIKGLFNPPKKPQGRTFK